MAVGTNFVEIQASPLRAGDPAYLGAFQIRGRLWHRPTTTSYLGVDPLRRMAVVTMFRSHGKAEISREEFERSLTVARKVHGSGVTPVLETGWEGGRPWLALRYVPGRMAAEIVAQPELSPEELLAFAAGTAAGLHALHRAGVVHGDLGPHSVVLAERGPVIVGFGGPPGHHGRVRGPWVGPESVKLVAPATDVYAWGWLVAAAALGADNIKFKELRRGSRLLSTDLSSLPHPLPVLVEQALHPYPPARPSAERIAQSLPLRQWPPRRVAPVLLAPKTYQPPQPGATRRAAIAMVLGVLALAVASGALAAASLR